MNKKSKLLLVILSSFIGILGITYTTDVDVPILGERRPSVEMNIGGNVNSGTAGSVLFVDSSLQLQQDNTNFYWDDTNNRLGIGTSAPAVAFQVSGFASISSGFEVGAAATTSVMFDSTSISQGACLVLKDQDGSGLTYCRANNGVLTCNTTSCK